jgi:uncharacterized protein YjbI with pentapeptide repeats
MPAPIVAYWEALPAWITLGLAVLAALLLGIGIWWVWWRLPRREAGRLALKIRDAKARADVEDNYRKTVGQALGGFAVLITGVFAYFQFVQNQATTFQTFISQQVSKGFEEIGNDKLEVRIGGIYTLEEALRVLNFYRTPVLQALSSMVRRKAATEPKNAQLEADVQAAMIVIGRNLTNTDLLYFDQTYLSRIDLQGADLRQANFSGAHLNESNLISVDLENANLVGADLTSANLTKTNLTSADLSRTNLTHANLTDADLTDADLTNANLTGANLTRANLTGANLTNADLTSAKLTDARIDQQQLNAVCGPDPNFPKSPPKPCPPSRP